MTNILRKEMKLSASPLTYIFILFGLMFFIPGYPILCGAFFVTLGLFHSFQYAREARDLEFSSLLPIDKATIVKGKYLFVIFIELCGFIIMLMATLIRMTALANSTIYRENALMNANLFALGAALIAFGIFNTVFLGGFFKTAYNLGKPFITYIIAVFFFIGLAEALHYFPGLEIVNSFGFDNLGFQIIMLLVGLGLFTLMTFLSCKGSCMNLERIDL